MDRKSIVAKLSLLLNVVLVLVLVFMIYRLGGVSFVTSQVAQLFSNEERPSQEEAYYEQRNSLFSQLKVSNDSTVMLGDSLIQYNEWSELFGNENLINRGISGDTTLGVLNRLDQIVKGQPNKIVLMVGINDIAIGVSSEETVDNYDKILSTIKENSPKTKVILNSVLPVNNEKFGDTISNETVESLNEQIKGLAEKYGHDFVNVYPKFIKDGQLSSEYTVDGVHLTGEGYLLWKNELQNYLN